MIALLGASAFFTFGAALGITGSWAAKIGTLVSKLGISGKMAGIISGSIVQAGQGAWIGGVTGALTGQGFMKGAAAGAAVGAVTGGVTGAIRPVAPGPGGGQPGTSAGGGPGTAGNPIGSGLRPSGPLSASPIGPLAETQASTSMFGSVWDRVIGSGGIGPILQGVGAGVGRGLEQRSIDKRHDERRDSYNVNYTPISPIFRQSGSKILMDRFEEA